MTLTKGEKVANAKKLSNQINKQFTVGFQVFQKGKKALAHFPLRNPYFVGCEFSALPFSCISIVGCFQTGIMFYGCTR